MTKLPRERLRSLRERAGISGSQVSRDLGYASAAGYLRYEQPTFAKDNPIPYDIVKRLIPMFVGRGNPPITAEEMLLLTDVRNIPAPVERAFSSIVSEADGLLAVKYRIERGVYIRMSSSRSYGASKIGASKMYAAEDQFAAALVEASDGLPQGTQFHCVLPTRFTQALLHNRRVIVGVKESDDLVEVRLGKMQSGKAFASNGMPLDGELLGVVVGSYVPE